MSSKSPKKNMEQLRKKFKKSVLTEAEGRRIAQKADSTAKVKQIAKKAAKKKY